MKRSEAQSVGEIIKEALEREHLNAAVDEQMAVTLWPRIVGTAINRYTLSRHIANGILTVRLSAAPLKAELMMHKPQLIASLNKAIGSEAVKDINFI